MNNEMEMTERPVRDDWTPYRADDPSTWPPTQRGYLWVTWAYVERVGGLDVARRGVELAGAFAPTARRNSRFRAVFKGAGIPNVVAWCRQQTPAPWDGE